MPTSSRESSPDNDRPLVSIVMPAYNAERYLVSALRSIQDQTVTDWELIVVDDGSTDGTAKLLAGFTDPRIRTITHPTNQGLPKSLNAGVRTARGRYIARLDADDIALPDRLACQLRFLIAHPDVGIVGTAARTIDENGNIGGLLWRPQHPVAVKFLALWETPLHHPTVMGPAATFKNCPYDERYVRAEDYDLWSRLLFENGITMTNLPQPLTLFRQHSKSFTKTVGIRGLEFAVGVPLRNMSHYAVVTDSNQALVTTYRSGKAMSLGQLLRFGRFIGKMTVAFWQREHPATGPVPAIARIAAGTFWRTMKKSWKHR